MSGTCEELTIKPTSCVLVTRSRCLDLDPCIYIKYKFDHEKTCELNVVN